MPGVVPWFLKPQINRRPCATARTTRHRGRLVSSYGNSGSGHSNDVGALRRPKIDRKAAHPEIDIVHHDGDGLPGARVPAVQSGATL